MRAHVIGNVAVDETIAVDALPAAGASIHGRTRSRDLGGKGANQAMVMARAGLPTTLVAGVGDDPRADLIRAELTGEPVEARLVVLPGRPSDFSIILTTPDGENAIVTTTECAETLTLADAMAPLADAEPGDLVVLQGNLDDAVTRGLLEAARGQGLVTAFNPSPPRAAFGPLWPLVDIAFLNTDEAERLTGTRGAAAATRLREAGTGTVVLTLGRAGALLATGDGIAEIPALDCPVADTTGAGDAFMATALASAALRGTGIDRRAVEDASRAAAITVGRPGTRSAFPGVEELAGILGA